MDVFEHFWNILAIISFTNFLCIWLFGVIRVSFSWKWFLMINTKQNKLEQFQYHLKSCLVYSF